MLCDAAASRPPERYVWRTSAACDPSRETLAEPPSVTVPANAASTAASTTPDASVVARAQAPAAQDLVAPWLSPLCTPHLRVRQRLSAYPPEIPPSRSKARAACDHKLLRSASKSIDNRTLRRAGGD